MKRLAPLFTIITASPGYKVRLRDTVFQETSNRKSSLVGDAMVYLYDWFSQSGEDDLGLALNTFVLEQTKDKLDMIIRNQGDIILNQQMQLSLQMQSNKEQENHFRMMENKVKQLEMEDEERNKNLDMIARTNESVLWYARQDYIRNMFM